MTSTTRHRRIVLFFSSVAVRLITWEWVLPRLGCRALVDRTRSARLHRIAARFRALAIEMGGVLIKVGQFLSSRVDVLPEEITSELAGLQDEVPPEEFAAVRDVMERELGDHLFHKLASIDERPLAAASLGQVHRAMLMTTAAETGLTNTDGAPQRDVTAAAASEEPFHVVIKVQRPNIETLIATDLAALRTVGRWLHRWPPLRRRADIPSLLAEFTRVLYEELDYLAEGRNAETFAANLAHDRGVRVPHVVWSHTTKHVLTLEDVFGIKITDYHAMTEAGIDRAQVARRLFRAYLQQIFRDGFFHADPHPGNLFVLPGREGDDWQLVFVDFGMAGRLAPAVRTGLRETAIAVGTRDIARLVRAQQQLGLLLPSANLPMLERAEARLFERLWGRTMADMQQIGRQEMLALLQDFRELLYTMPFHVPEDLILLGRTVGILSGMCTGLNPQFNVWNELTPFARTLLAEDSTFDWRILLDEAWDVAGAVLAVPKQAEAVLGKLNRSELALQVPRVEEQLARLELTVRRMVGAVICAASLLGAVQLYVVGQMTASAWLAAGALVALMWSATRRP
jgi:predicted unusual protein kinase regulating ubiquinone biosynthesis (AarF/ABC1/UbiB family)